MVWQPEVAEAQANEMVSVYDVLIVDPETGETHIDFGRGDDRGKDGDGDGNDLPKAVSRQVNPRA